jgi:hypothetical protein
VPRPFYSPFYHSHNIGWGVQIIKLLLMKFSPLCCLVPLTYILYNFKNFSCLLLTKVSLNYFTSSVVFVLHFTVKS